VPSSTGSPLTGFRPFGPAGLPLHHPTAACERRGFASELQGSPYTRPQGPSARAASFVKVFPAAHRSDDAQLYLDQRCQVDARIARAHGLTQTFLIMVRERRGRDLEAWITAATDSGIDALARFPRGLRDDLTAVTAGLTLPWSNGPVEG
jgi:hypothetical protein